MNALPALLYRVEAISALVVVGLSVLLAGPLAAAEEAPTTPPALDLDLLPALPSINDGWPAATESTAGNLDESHARMEELLGDVVRYVVQERSQPPIYSAVRPARSQMRAQVETPPPADLPPDASAGDR